MENIFLLVLVTLLSVLQNGEFRNVFIFTLRSVCASKTDSIENPARLLMLLSPVISCVEAFFAQKVEKECKAHDGKTAAIERLSCAK